MKKLDKILKITAAACAIIFIMGLIGSGVGIARVINGDLSSIGIDKETIDKFNKRNPITNTYKASEVKNIYIDSSIGDIIVKENLESSDILISSTHSDDTKFKVENGTLSVDMNKNNIYMFGRSFSEKFSEGIVNLLGLVDSNRSITILLPKDVKLNNLNIDVDYGNIKVSSGGYENLYVNSDFGNTDISLKKYTLINKLKTESSFGDIELNNIDALNFESSNSKGNINIYMENGINSDKNKIDIENDMGDIEITMKNIDRNINISNNMGNLDFISQNPLSKNVNVSVNGSLGESKNNFTYKEETLEKNVEVSIDYNMGSVRLSH